MSCSEGEGFGGKWAIITLHPSLPSLTEQLARLRAWGVPEKTLDGGDVCAMVVDDVRKQKRTTNWPAALKNRADFFAGLKTKDMKATGEKVFFATPHCIGFGQAHARQTIEALWAADRQVYVHSIAALYVAGDDIEDLLVHVEREATTARVRRHRARKGDPEITLQKRKRKS